MKRSAMLFFTLLCALLFSQSALAAELVAEGNCYNSTALTWTFTDDGTLTISGEGELPDTPTPAQIPWSAYADQIKKIVVAEGVTAVGEGAFYWCSAAEEVVLPESVTAIGDWAFGHCQALKSIVLPKNLEAIGANAFRDCIALSEIVIPDGVTTLGEAAFRDCKALQSANLPASLTTLERQIFMDCTALESAIVIPEGITAVPEAVFYQCEKLSGVTIPSTVTAIGEWAFFRCWALTALELPEGLKSIDGYAFRWCSALTEMNIPNSVETLGEAIFDGCSELVSVTLPDSLTAIPAAMFQECFVLADLDIPSGVTEVGAYAFARCNKLKIDFLPQLTSIGAYAFSYCYQITELTLPAVITEIAEGAFHSCVSMHTLNLHEGITDIGPYAFYNCTKVKVLELPESVKTIGEHAFRDLEEIIQVRIPTGVELLGAFAFASCNDLENVIFLGDSTALTSGAFAENSADYPVLWGYAGSGVEKYAAAEGINFMPYGDSDSRFYGTCGEDLRWKLSEDGVLVIYGTSPMDPYNGQTVLAPWQFLSDLVTAVVIEDEVPSLSNGTFRGYPKENYPGYINMKRLTIGSGMTDLGAESFGECPALEEIVLSPENSTYILQDNVLYSADGKRLVLYPAGRVDTSFITPRAVEVIAASAFRHADGLNQVVLWENLTTVEDRAFSDCTGIDLLTLPESLSDTGIDAFQDCRVATNRYPLTEALGSANNGSHNYETELKYGGEVYSYLAENGDGSLCRVEYNGSDVYVERYIRDGREFKWESGFRLKHSYELMYFAGFYSTEDYNFLAFYEGNGYEIRGREVIRIVRYSKDWTTRLSSASYLAANTKFPCDFGSFRMAHYGDYLYVHTAHSMFRSSADGRNHQANLTLQIDQRTMDVVAEGSTWDFMEYNFSPSYVSHSFNQFVSTRNGELTILDHGDAYPRSIVATQFVRPAGEEGLADLNIGIDGYTVLSIAGGMGDNVTGAMVGAYQPTDEAYLTAGSSVVQDQDFSTRKAYNIFLHAMPRTGGEGTMQWLTDYQEGDGLFAGAPHMVEIASDKYLLLWTEHYVGLRNNPATGAMFYVYVDAMGQLLGEVQRFDGALSDCAPVCVDGGALWYVTNGGAPVFYYLKGDTLLTAPVNGDTAALASHKSLQLMTAVYAGNGQLDSLETEKLSDGVSVTLEQAEGTVIRHFLVEDGVWTPLCVPFA